MLATQTVTNPTKANVLIVDDQLDNLRTLSAMLTQQGYKVRKAVSGEVALETARLDPPSLILLDIRMPQMNGFEVCSALKQSTETNHIPVIFLSALNDVTDKVKAFTAGGADYITKPFQTEEVLIRIQHQLAIQRQQHQFQQEIQERRYAEELLRLQLQREQLLTAVTSYICETVQLDEILEKTVREIRVLLNVDRVLICQFSSKENLEVITESVRSPEFSLLGQTLQNPSVRGDWNQLSQNNPISVIENIRSANVPKDWMDLWTHLQVEASVVHSIQQSNQVWGCLIAHDCTNSRTWEQWEIEMLQRLTVQLAIAIGQAALYQAAQVQIDQLQKLVQLRDDFLHTIFHELCNRNANSKLAIQMLTTTIQQNDFLLRELPQLKVQKDKITQYLDILRHECEREQQLVQDLLDLQHLETGTQPLELAPIDLKHWIPNITESFKLRMQNQRQTLYIQLEPGVRWLTTDFFCFSRILAELVNNACKYTPVDETITLSACVEDGILSLSVINSGVEISAEELSLIFNRFYRVRSHDFWKSGGTGLGLALVKRLVEYINGSIRVVSANQQTCFTVQLPLHQNHFNQSDFLIKK